MIINEILEDYISLLRLYWPSIEQLISTDTTGSFKDNWLQANWELIVERQLMSSDTYLEVYGDGADCNDASSRVLFPNENATYNLILKPKNKDNVYDILGEIYINNKDNDIIFQKFVTIKEDGWYYEEPPFDMVEALYRDEVIIVRFDAVNVELGIIS